MKKIFITGAAGFIGFHTSQKLLDKGYIVVGIDNFNDYYDTRLKRDRIKEIKKHVHADKFTIIEGDILDTEILQRIARDYAFDAILHLAAYAGVRYSLENPTIYEEVNGLGTLNMLELARHTKVQNFVFASSSSVYGGTASYPSKETDRVDRPISLYAATKKANELTAFTYHNSFGIPITGLRFFTVYGPWGRPDMALSLFTDAIVHNKPIKVFNFGKMARDFTYIDDIVQGIVAALQKPHDYEVFNLGYGESVPLELYITSIEKAMNKKAERELLPMPLGDVPKSSADISKAQKMLGYHSTTPVEVGVPKFIEWYKKYYTSRQT